MSEIPNPVKLTFRVEETPWRETTMVESEENLRVIPLREIFKDDLERTLWLAIKSRHITSQYFNHQVRAAAESIRTRRPLTPKELHGRIMEITGRHNDGDKSFGADAFCEELFLYVTNVLDGGNNLLKYKEPD